LAMKTTVLAYLIGLGGLAAVIFGLWGLVTDKVPEHRMRDYMSAIQTIAVGLVLIASARGLLLLLIIATHPLR
jgi:hypothetical protein